MRSRNVILAMSLALLLLAVADLLLGAVSIPPGEVFDILMGGEGSRASWRYIILDARLPQMLTALLSGAALAVSGLMLQTAFRNPLAGPSVLGITNGASLGVALVMLVGGGVVSLSATGLAGPLAVVSAALLGALLIIALLLSLSLVVRSHLMLLIVGIMVSYLTSSVVSLCNYFASADDIQSYVLWGMGSFSDVSRQQLPLFTAFCLVGLLLSALLTKSLNLLLLGDRYAANLGLDIRRTRRLVLLATGLLSAVVTAYCGPVAFIGLAVPHIARLLTASSDHHVLLPTTALTGAVIAILCNLLCALPGNMIIPLNAVTPLFGAPVIIYIILRSRPTTS